MSAKVDASMHSISEHLRAHREWPRVAAIESQAVVTRQDDDRVGLLQDKGVREVAEAKGGEGDELATFIDTNLAVNMLTTAAKRLDAEFQAHLQLVMSRLGDFKAGPIKTVQRCQGKLESDYADAAYPKAARLLDVVRCSVSFNTLEQLLAGYQGLMRHVATAGNLQLARVKNGFLASASEAAYRDI